MEQEQEYVCGRCCEVKPVSGFYLKGGVLDTTWCKKCYREWYVRRAGGLVTKDCEHCGTEFTATARSARRRRFCTRECKNLRRRKLQRQETRKAKAATRTCLHCASTYGADKRADAMFCTERCQEANSNWVKRTNQRSEDWGADPFPGGHFNRAELISRSEGQCPLCAEPIDFELPHPNPKAPSVDHIKPLADGGTNDMNNLQITHLCCNLSKG